MSVLGQQPSVVVITGVTRGLGRAMVKEFIHRGHKVFGCARTREQIDELTRLYPTHNFHVVDVVSDRLVKEWADRFTRLYEAPDLLINNAGIFIPKAPLWEVAEQDFSEAVDINIKGVANVIRHFVPSMIRRKRGVILNVTSRWGEAYQPVEKAASRSKSALGALSDDHMR